MNYKLVTRMLGHILMIEAAIMLPALIISVIYKEGDWKGFVITMLILFVVGGIMSLVKKPDKKMLVRDGIMIVGLAWILLTAFGALPFWIDGAIPNYVDAFFETMSGFTTTGATILTDVEALPKGLLFWRSLTHWFGGMGFLVFSILLMSSMDGQIQYLMRAESTGPTTSKLVPKIKDTTRILYTIYIVLTVLCVIALVIAKMPLYDALLHAFGTLGTGGFGIKNSGVAYYNSAAIDIILSIFMLVAGVNFTLYFLLLKKRVKDVWKNEELRMYVIMVTAAVVIIAINIKSMYGSWGEAFRHSLFQVSSIITTTGFSTTDFNLWPMLSKIVLVVLMLVGGCAGSTAGGIKQIRVLVMGKMFGSSSKQLLNPRAMVPVKMDGKVLEKNLLINIATFIGSYFLLMFAALLLVSFDNFDFETTVTAVIATISNIGPGLGKVGPMGNFSEFSNFSKIILSVCMLLGRLEIFPVIALFRFDSWKRA